MKGYVNACFLISGNHQLILTGVVRHLDHKNVACDAQIKSFVIQTATALARQIRLGGGFSDIGFVSDLCRHLRKSLQATVDLAGEELNLNLALQTSIQECLLETAKGVTIITLISSFHWEFILLLMLVFWIDF